MSRTQAHTRRKPLLAGLGATAVLVTAAALVPGSTPAEAAAYSPPPAHAGFDYQIGGAYTPPAGVEVVSRDHSASPAPGLYNICYVNAFQAQPGAEGDWDDDLLLRDANGDVVYDTDWGEAFLDIRTADKRERIADKVGTWIDGCADKGFQAVEPDNYDSYTRAGDLLDAADAQGLIRLLAERAHSDGLAIGQKNTVELAPNREENGLDFAVAEECGEWDECGDYTAEFGDRVIVVEYTAEGLSKACAGFGDELSIVRRDLDVSPKGSSGYVRETC
ncbi:endo alpha-1,4 polygalactosaminidase [Streptomyces coelicoflavus]|uniref:Endo alpha-1,4 polygalactosaminidase n=1 Tax=Streptomyces coelicoflavus TaxID=285562 RepID=A0A6N9UH29_9ACTN|nr:endo alpha-1,4 polygalactosaminidase [Streptomyces coelicoflavus]NEB17068.1 endo alpha-1,4 polygalactosaminidase [Streptomyces coelicoflavus]